MPSEIKDHNNQEAWEIDNQEKCTFLPKHADSNREPYLVNIWKTMPFIPRGLPLVWIVMLSDSIYQNDTECRPSVASQIPLLRRNIHLTQLFSASAIILHLSVLLKLLNIFP